MKRLLIFDASNYIFRAFFASPAMNNSKGFPTNALHFYTSMILSVIRRIHPDAVALAHEMRGPKFRHALYSEYKAQRGAPPDALVLQFPWFRKITDALGLHAYDAQGYEADDIIATLTRQARQQDWHVVIATSDKDLMQLVERQNGVDTVCLFDAMAKSHEGPHFVTIDDVIARFKVEPARVADVLALSGDTSDNIPGCKGIGEKTAGALIVKFGSLEELIARRAEITKPAQRANLDAFAPQAALSKQLVSLAYDAPVHLAFDALNPRPKDVREVFSALDMIRLLHDILGPDVTVDPSVPKAVIPQTETQTETQIGAEPATPLPASEHASPVTDPRSRAFFCPKSPAGLRRQLFDTEVLSTTASLKEFIGDVYKEGARVAILPVPKNTSVVRPELLGIALSTASRAVYFPMHTQRSLFALSNASENSLPILLEFLNSPHPKSVYGVKPLVALALSHRHPIDIAACFDVEIAAYLLHPESQTTLGICARNYLDVELPSSPETWLLQTKKKADFLALPDHAMANIAGAWAQIIVQLAEILPDELQANLLTEVYRDIDLPVAGILANMEFHGIGVDVQALHALARHFDEELQKLDAKAHSFSDADFNINSPKSLAQFLFQTLGLTPKTKKKSTYGLSTDQDTLESIDHPIAQIILDYRAISKLRSTYSDSLAELADPQTHRIHGRFNGCVTATTRLSSSEPNLQNIPARTELGRQIKRAFIPSPGCSFVSADYSQIELRLMAAFSHEPVLCSAYQRGEDVHARTAAALLNIDIHEVTKAQRQLAKTINFGLIYGMGVQKLARETGIDKKEAKAFLDTFHAQFPTLMQYLEKLTETAREQGEVRTLLGHRRPIPELFSTNAMIKATGGRIATNTPIQGSASDIVKRAMLRLDDALHAHHLHATLLVQIHDELLLECPDSEVPQTTALLREAMEHAVDIGIPLKVEVKVGKNWADMNA